MADWDLKTNIEGIYAAGDQLFASDCCGHACATGYYAGRKAAEAALHTELKAPDQDFLEREKERLYAPLAGGGDMDWRELNMAIAKTMQNYCGGIRCEDLLLEGLNVLDGYERDIMPQIKAVNPHELMRVHEVGDILTVARLIINASLLRRSSSKPLCFERSDCTDVDPERDRRFITIRFDADGKPVEGSVPLGFFGDLEAEYEKRNADYIGGAK
jgi:succinate dehydrogenase/fumarate reductase flavoprotein subunit